MPAPGERAPIDYEALAEHLAALAYPLRLALLDRLDEPLTLSEIRIAPHRRDDAGSPDRPAAAPTVLSHLERLVEAGLVTTGTTRAKGRELTTYAVNPQRLYALTEEVRRLSVKHTGRGRSVDETGTMVAPAASRAGSGPRLVVVHGAYESRAFHLVEATQRDGAWIIGRRKDAAVALDYDPFVSLENSVIARRGGRYVLMDLAGNKNGTSVDWTPLARGGSADLTHGQIVGVGRSMLVFYER